MKYTREVLFCARYLSGNGITADNFNDVLQHLNKLSGEYTIVKMENRDFYYELASRLREMWPPGEKDGKYPWRDSVDNLRRRLQELWKIRFPNRTLTIEQCLAVARKYLSQFQGSTKYMQILKYFIKKEGTSKFADMLDSESELAQAMAQYTEDESVPTEEGVLI